MDAKRVTDAPLRATVVAKRQKVELPTLDEDEWMEAAVPVVGSPTRLCCAFRLCKKHKDVEKDKEADEEVRTIVEASLLCQETLPEA